MIKYILHGGRAGDENDDNLGFFKEMTVSMKNRLNFLINGFACDTEKVADKFERHSAKFNNLSGDKKIDFKLADKDFINQIKWADVVYFEGGAATEILLEKLKPFGNFQYCLEGKTIGGSSAGANIFAKYYFGNDSKKIGEGLGYLNIKTICHYTQKDAEIFKKLDNFKENLPVIALPEYKWKIFET